MRKTIALTTLALGVGALGVWIRSVDQQDRARTADGRDEVAALRTELASLRRNVQLQNLTIRAAAPAAEAPTDVDDDERPVVQEAAPQPVETKPELSAAEQLENLNDRFFEQPRDSAWGRASMPIAAQELRARLPAESRLTALECRESLCRAETQHANVEAYRKFMHATFTEMKWDGPGTVRLDGAIGSGPVKSVAYLAKPDVDLSALASSED